MKSKALYFEKENVCKNCGSEQIDNYCSNCGQKIYTKRFTVRSFFFVILNTLSIERGFFYTAKLLFTHPGKVVNDYIKGKTRSHYNPLKYLLISIGIYAFLIIGLNILDSSIETSNKILNKAENPLQMPKKIMDSFKQIVNFLPLLIIPITSLLSKWFYKSKKLFYGEHLIINCFLFGQIFILISLFTSVVVIFPLLKGYFEIMTLFIYVVYLSYSLHSVFKDSPLIDTIKATLIFFIGLSFFMILFSILFFIIVVVMAFMGYNITELA